MKSKKEKQHEQLPTVSEVVKRFMTPGTKLVFPEKQVTFSNRLSPVVSLEVTISSTEANDMQALHKLHILTRSTT